jgi:hypothetical protein
LEKRAGIEQTAVVNNLGQLADFGSSQDKIYSGTHESALLDAHMCQAHCPVVHFVWQEASPAKQVMYAVNISKRSTK